MFLVEIDIDTKEAEAYFEYAGHHTRSARRPLTKMLTFIRGRVNLAFDTEGSAALGYKWKPLSKKYAIEKAIEFPGRGILVREGLMYRYAITAGEVTNTGLEYAPVRYNNEGDELVEIHHYGREDSLAFNHKGDAYMSGGMPARPFFTWDEVYRETLDHIFEEWLDELRTYNTRRSGPATRPGAPEPVDYFRF